MRRRRRKRKCNSISSSRSNKKKQVIEKGIRRKREKWKRDVGGGEEAVRAKQ